MLPKERSKARLPYELFIVEGRCRLVVGRGLCDGAEWQHPARGSAVPSVGDEARDIHAVGGVQFDDRRGCSRVLHMDGMFYVARFASVSHRHYGLLSAAWGSSSATCLNHITR